MRVAVVGAFGQLGSELCSALGPRAIPLGHDQIEITNADSVHAALTEIAPTHVINCAAYNFVDKAEAETETAMRANALGPRNLAQWCAAHETILMHISTDYVFGLNRDRALPWREEDAPGPVSAYGISKLTGEYFVRSTCPRHFVVRTCGLYGNPRGSGGKGNFVETMIRLGRERPELRIVSDQRCTPTSTRDLAEALAALIETDAYGLFHATNFGDCSWFEFAREIFKLTNISVKTTPVTSLEYGAKANRPTYSVLNCEKLATTIGCTMPSWQNALMRYVNARMESPG